MEISTVGVIGVGTMGSGVVEVAARTGLQVVAREATPELVEAGRGRVEKSMDRGVARGKLDEAARDAASAAIAWTTDLEDLAGCQLVLEAVPERLPLKLEIFGVLDRVLDPAAIMATNTSSIPIIDVAMGTSRPEQVLGMHFFNPATVMKLVEVISTQLTAPEVTEAATAFATDTLGKRVVPAPDRAGFVVNKLLVPYICQAIEMYESGHASASDIDDAMKLGAGHPMGPLTLADLIGLDVCLFTAESLYAEYAERFYAPPPLLRRMVAAGRLGRKTGRGFYDY
ncbi:MAG: 3-hydroxybutyryl-CoA dehydrogenase [Acidimicrobiaceae bacterium]|nr:3-hydroxybutyryl-CoA dehydrogenase [Acidimicrobiaceae bacterium]MYG98615.1 3-hydroxybutyryl-CoA dehydrogenase [Acidimicrobiaceae bacterium]MYL02696.1 3-hydroxybutyryl-CoA dehydrogenase [Acidimicrobiaceae bacterium]